MNDSARQPASPKPLRSGRRPSWLTPRAILALVLTVIAVVFIVENRQLAEIRILIPVVTMPLWAALAASVIVGVLIGYLVRRSRQK